MSSTAGLSSFLYGPARKRPRTLFAFCSRICNHIVLRACARPYRILLAYWVRVYSSLQEILQHLGVVLVHSKRPR